MKETTEQSGKNKNFINLSILLAIALFIGVYLIVTTAVIAKDGVVFIEYAKKLHAAPVKTMVRQFQHPGFGWLILMVHKLTQLFQQNTSILSWIYCAQSTALIFRLLSIIILYFIAKQLLNARIAFWSILILIFLPKPAEYGSDALSDWPHLFFLTMGLLLLINGAINSRWWLFGPVGLAAGAGYLIRPECAQLVVLGSLWLGLQLCWSKRTMSKSKALSALIVLFVGFLIFAGAYMKLKGAVFPKKNVGQFALTVDSGEINQPQQQTIENTTYHTESVPQDFIKAVGKLFENIGETLMWFFVPTLFIGMYKRFKTRKWYEPEKFFVIAIAALNIPVMIWLYCKYGYMSDRHMLPMLILPILYVPVGLHEVAIWCQERFAAKTERFWFLLLFFIGISVCVPKLLRPIRIEKQGYRTTAQWLNANTNTTDRIAVPDKRITFYSQRKGLVYENGNIPSNVVYIVKIFKDREDKTVPIEPSGKFEYEYFDKTKRGLNVVIYRNQ